MTRLIDLRELLDERADEVGHLPTLGEHVVIRGHRMRNRRRYATAGAAAAVVAVGLAFVVPAVGGDDVGPSSNGGDSDAASDGPRWASNIDGLDLPVGDHPHVAYAVGNKIVDLAKTYTVPGTVTDLLTVPGGFVVTLRDVTGDDDFSSSSGALATVSQEGDVRIIDVGSISGVAASNPAYGDATAIAWGSDDSGQYQVKLASPFLDDPPHALKVDARSEVVGFDGGDPIVVQLGDGSGTTARWDLGTDKLTATSWQLPIGADPEGKLAVYFDNDTQCTYAISADDPGDKAWENCDQTHRPPLTMSPDGKWLAFTSAYWAATGEFVRDLDLGVSFNLGSGANYSAMVLGWERDTVLLLQISVSPAPTLPSGGDTVITREDGSYVDVRCDVTTGECQRLPGEVDLVAATPLPGSFPQG